MEDQRVGSAIRAVRQRRGWRQADLARRARVSQTTISRLERGHFSSLSLASTRRIAAELDVRLDLVPRWRAGDLDRLLNARHSRLHELVARYMRERHPAWVLAPEVTFAHYADRGVIDIVAWHPAVRALLVIELKTDIADVNELLGTFDRKLRVVRVIAPERGWNPVSVSGWVIVAPGRTNKARIAAHQAMLRSAFPLDSRSVSAWLRHPAGRVMALSQWRNSHPGTATADLTPVRRVQSTGRRGI